MIKNGQYYCDDCSKKVRNSLDIYVHKEKHYCNVCFNNLHEKKLNKKTNDKLEKISKQLEEIISIIYLKK